MKPKGKSNWRIYGKFWIFGLIVGMFLLNLVSAELIETPDELWNKTAGLVNEDDKSHAVAVDSEYNIIVTGVTGSFGAGLFDIWTIKYDSEGNILWDRTAGWNRVDSGQDVAVDSYNNIIVIGSVMYFGTEDWGSLIIKYDSNGNVRWNRTIDFGDYVRGSGVAVDSKDNIIVTGTTHPSDVLNYNFWTAKYDPDGDMLWNKTAGGSSNDKGYAIAVDSNDDIIVIGDTESFGMGDSDLWIIKYDSDGNVIWNKTVGCRHYDGGSGVAVDSNDNIVVTGATRCFAVLTDNFWTIKYDPDGNMLWNKTAGVIDGSGYGNGVAIDSNDNIIVTGDAILSGEGYSDGLWTIKYDPDGDMLWNKTAGRVGGSSSEDSGNGVAIDSNDDIIVTGYMYAPFNPTYSDFWTIKYTTLEVEEGEVEEKVESVTEKNIDKELEEKTPDWKTYLIIAMLISGLILLFILFRKWKKAIM